MTGRPEHYGIDANTGELWFEPDNPDDCVGALDYVFEIAATDGIDTSDFCEIVLLMNCCIGWRGNADMQGGIDVGDLTFLIGYLFQSGSAPTCLDEADVDGSGSIDVGDLTHLTQYLFQFGPPPASCR